MDDILLNESQIKRLVSSISRRINKDYPTEPIIILCILSGASLFACDLVKKIAAPTTLLFAKCSSYKGESRGRLSFDYWPDFDFTGKHVIIVEDIVDSGSTIRQVIERVLKNNEPASYKVCSLIKRQGCPCYVDYLGCQVSKGLWIYGYGMDYPENINRNLVNIYIKS